jgi:hypothetical protein
MTDADIMPDEKNGVLRITIHNMTNPGNNRYVQQLCDILNSSETLFTGTNQTPTNSPAERGRTILLYSKDDLRWWAHLWI